MSILRVHDVSIRYMTGDFKDIGVKEYLMRRLTHNYHVQEFWADRHISFELEEGEMMGIIGSNGAGKSTLLKAIAGIMEPTEGYIERDGKIVALLELGSGFDGDLTVKENTYLRGAMLGYTRRFMDNTYDQIIEFSGLKEFEDRPFKQLSSGMKSRLAFSIASLVEPEILILDEVLSVGDGGFKKKSEAKMTEIIKGGATTILVSHSLSQVQQLCTKILWLERGEQVAYGDTSILCSLYQQFLDRTLTLEQAKACWRRLNRHFDYLVVGAGLFGAVFAKEASKLGKHCLVVDRRRALGGAAMCEEQDGITVHKYGPHIFHTDEKDLWRYISRYTEMLPCDGGYGERYQGIASEGYSGFVQTLLKGLSFVLGVKGEDVMKAFPDVADKVIYTGSIDEFFENCFGRLRYWCRRYENETINMPEFQKTAIVEVNDDKTRLNRIIEYKHFTGAAGDKTVIAREYLDETPGAGERYEPVCSVEDEQILQKYKQKAEQDYPNVIFAGRLGEYKPYTMAQTIKAARALARSLAEQTPVEELAAPTLNTCAEEEKRVP